MQYYTASTQLPPYLPYPRFLLTLPLSETAKLVYTLILSRIHLSQSNGWADEDGRVYCRYPIMTLAADCYKSKSTIVTALADLEKQGLLFRRRGGAGYANKLYLKLPDICTSEGQKTEQLRSGKLVSSKSKKDTPNYDYIGDSL